MKLVEILARGITHWRDEWAEIYQSSVDGEIYAYDKNEDMTSTGIFLEQSEDPDTYVTRPQWQAERDKMRKMEALIEARDNPPSTEPTYEQQLWDLVAVASLSMYEPLRACDQADAFMAERSKRIKGGE